MPLIIVFSFIWKTFNDKSVHITDKKLFYCTIQTKKWLMDKVNIKVWSNFYVIGTYTECQASGYHSI